MLLNELFVPIYNKQLVILISLLVFGYLKEVPGEGILLWLLKKNLFL